MLKGHRMLATSYLSASSEPASGRGHSLAQARLAQSAERKALNLVVVGSSPTVGVGATLIMRW